MRVLFLAPLPPPVTGHALASKTFLDALRQAHETTVVNLSMGSTHDGTVTGRRIVEVAKLLRNVWRQKQAADVIYLTISESVAGNIKDLAIYLLCSPRLSTTFIHLHGGSIKKLLFDRYPLLEKINAIFIRRMAGVIVSGRAHEHIFANVIDPHRIHIVPNFAQDCLFVSEQQVVEKFADVEPLRVLYMSGMTEAKGYQYLAEAYLRLSSELQRKLRIDFAGKFDSEAEKSRFLAWIADHRGMQYHGLVDEVQKQVLFSKAHFFCLPTSMFEGQPISILEAYASGCVVLTTGQDGIRDVFSDGVNGFEFEAKSARSLGASLQAVAADVGALLPIALRNRSTADVRYRTSTYNTALTRIVESAARSRGEIR